MSSTLMMGQPQCVRGLTCLTDRFSLLQVHATSGILHCCNTQKEDQDSGTESDKDSCIRMYSGPQYGAVSPEVVSCGSTSLAEQLAAQHQLVTCVSHPIYSRDTFPLHHGNHGTMATMLAWQHLNIDSKLSKQSKTYFREAYLETNNNNSEFAQTLQNMRPDSGDSCICDCDGYNSEDELTSINCVELADNDPNEDEEELELEQILGGGLEWGPQHAPQMTTCQRVSSGRWQADSADEGFQEDMMCTPQPLRFCSSPPEGVHRSTCTMSPQEFLACALPPSQHAH